MLTLKVSHYSNQLEMSNTTSIEAFMHTLVDYPVSSGNKCLAVVDGLMGFTTFSVSFVQIVTYTVTCKLSSRVI